MDSIMKFYCCILLMGGASVVPRTTHAFTLHNSIVKGQIQSMTTTTSSPVTTVRHAAPKRLEENVEGVVYVNDKVCVEFVLYSTA